MNISSITASTGQEGGVFRDFCVDPKQLSKNRYDKTWVKILKEGEYSYMAGVGICQIDLWGDELCSVDTRFQRASNINEYKAQSCAKARLADSATFDSEREVIEKQPWTLTEMRKALKWVFNCTGKIPLKTCN